MIADRTLRERFGHALAQAVDGLRAGETACAWLQAEEDDFIRFNHGRVRQAGSVIRATLELRLVDAGRQASLTCTLTGRIDEDARLLAQARGDLRAILADSDPDPHGAIDEHPRAQTTGAPFMRPDPSLVCDTVCAAAGGADLVGFYAGGPMACGFASSAGHALWHEAGSWFFDYCVYVDGDKAVKSTLADVAFDADRIVRSIHRAREDAAILARPPKVLAPGRYRASLAPAALAEIVGMLNWGGFSHASHAAGQSPLAALRDGTQRFHPSLTLVDALDDLGLPRFQSDGFARPAHTRLIENGRFAGSLVSPRSAREFGVPGTGAGPAETADALSMSGGELDAGALSTALGTGVAISNLWYLNWSDRAAGRMTGMTRFASLWVEQGEAVAPVSVMRFDDTLHRMLGSELIGLTRHPERIPDTMTYDARGFGAMRVPGALLSSLNLTL